MLFRQIHSDQNEPASFKVVQSILSAASASSEDDLRDDRMRLIKEWGGARTQLLRRNDHAALFEDEVGGSLTEFDFQEILVDFSHFYLGYAKVLEAALGAV